MPAPCSRPVRLPKHQPHPHKHMPVPITQIPNLQRTDVRVGVNPNAGADVGRSISQAGQQITQAAGQLASYKQKMNVAEFNGASSGMENDLATAYDEFQMDITKADSQLNDHTKWGEEWAMRSEAIKQSHLKSVSLDQGYKDALSSQFDEDNVKRSLSVRGMTEKRTAAIAKESILSNAERLLRDGDFSGYEKEIMKGVESNVINEEDAPKMLQEGLQRSDEYEAIALIETNPKAAEDALSDKTETGRFREFKNLSPRTRKSLLGSARQRGVDEQAELYNSMVLDIQRGTLIPPDQVVAMADEGKLTSGQATAYIKQHHGAKGESFNPVEYADLRARINQYDPTTDPTGINHAMLKGDILGQPSREIAELNGLLGKKVDPKAKVNSGTYKEGFKLVESWFTAGVFGDATTLQGVPIDEAAYKDAQRNKLTYLTELDRFFEEKPNATYTEVFDHFNGLLSRERRGAGLNILRQESSSQFGNTDDEKEAALNRILSR